ncbi:hypothetical protein OJ996_23300 [Luteolibacter sp. GHJ8]|uniref:Integron gene cassette protein n=1 Tax=Luteolibacter rhizosphaerae TaxID=2989719 RepID=A0ABT3G9K6_9BACT|nr:hypothetical protein [Luteolibacter rhizosphaerae]MCW1916533.1 hypothetical protein [Luteolibacter rhizosphaerae]
MNDGEPFFLGIGIFAVVMGVISALATSDRGKKRWLKVSGPLLAAIALPLVLFFLMGFCQWYDQPDPRFLDAIRSGLAATLIYGRVVTVGCTVISLIFFGTVFCVVRVFERSGR